jgi:hypothetical protein
VQGSGNTVFTNTVTVKNTDAANPQKLMLCALGNSIVMMDKMMNPVMMDADFIDVKLAAGQDQSSFPVYSSRFTFSRKRV